MDGSIFGSRSKRPEPHCALHHWSWLSDLLRPTHSKASEKNLPLLCSSMNQQLASHRTLPKWESKERQGCVYCRTECPSSCHCTLTIWIIKTSFQKVIVWKCRSHIVQFFYWWCRPWGYTRHWKNKINKYNNCAKIKARNAPLFFYCVCVCKVQKKCLKCLSTRVLAKITPFCQEKRYQIIMIQYTDCIFGNKKILYLSIKWH